MTKQYGPIAIIEAGYGNFYIENSRVIFAILIKVVDSRTNKVIARTRAVARLPLAKYDLDDPYQLQQFIAVFQTGFGNAVAKAVPGMLGDIGL